MLGLTALNQDELIKEELNIEVRNADKTRYLAPPKIRTAEIRRASPWRSGLCDSTPRLDIGPSFCPLCRANKSGLVIGLFLALLILTLIPANTLAL